MLLCWGTAAAAGNGYCSLSGAAHARFQPASCNPSAGCQHKHMPAVAHPPVLYLLALVHTGIGATSTGHCHPHVVKAVQEQAAKIVHAQQNVLAGHTKRVGVISPQQRALSTYGQLAGCTTSLQWTNLQPLTNVPRWSGYCAPQVLAGIEQLTQRS